MTTTTHEPENAGLFDTIRPSNPVVITNGNGHPPGPEHVQPFAPIPPTANAPVPELASPATLKKSTSAPRKEARQQAALSEALQNGIYRRPPNNGSPVLKPENRYCSKCLFIKPPRAHHCRACGTCVLRYDHHCPWIGGCVGQRNHKYFMNFNLATVFFTSYTLATLIAFHVRFPNSSFNQGDIDPQIIIIIVFAALFDLFTVLLFASHVLLTLRNQTTVESLGFRAQKEREDAQLARLFGFWGCVQRGAVKASWDKIVGRVGKENNIWWRGTCCSSSFLCLRADQ
ncbi:vacuole protein [Moniliophthora roreri MCA 2997]|uniref:Palmitoyltransferase n=1 Tax=Moniliophthora roreri (strain MCA 2997) TaxID=1381753 RepID=V2XHV6_MONRO|nr:vacuole protein [Moniliophthora roreri MCA 2997]